MKKILVTGAAGFIGYSLIKKIFESNYRECHIIGIDNMNNYYDEKLKYNRLSELLNLDGKFSFIKCDISDKDAIFDLFKSYSPNIVINLAAQAGVRYSITNPNEYIQSNIVGFYNILESCRFFAVDHLIYASSSSVYGLNSKIPYTETDPVDRPVSLYAATKKSNELIAHAYSKLYNIPCTGLRFFTVYGPMGRPDMSYFKFADQIIKGEKIQLFNYGKMSRDFTYIDDIVNCMINIIKNPPKTNSDGIRYNIYNIGNNNPVELLKFVDLLEHTLIKNGVINSKIEKEFLPMQPGDVVETFADISKIKQDYDFTPMTNLSDGLNNFAAWYKKYISLE